MSSRNGDAPPPRRPPAGYGCGACGATFDDPRDLANHVVEAHLPSDDD